MSWELFRAQHVLLWLTALLLSFPASAQPAAEPKPGLLGRSPVENISSILSARFVSTDIDDILAVQNIGRIPLSAGASREKAEADLCRLVLLRLAGQRFEPVWQSEPLLSSVVPAARLAANAWAVCDMDRDGLSELLLFGPESCAVVRFHTDSIRKKTIPAQGAWPAAAVACDLDDDSVPEIATLELSPYDSSLSARLLRLYRISDSALVPLSDYTMGIVWEQEPVLLGSCRLEDYWGVLPMLAGVHRSLRPSTYAVLTRNRDSLRLTSRPFPWREWFSKEQLLPAGRLSLFNVEDTLTAYGYFVPGSGRQNSFAALQDGEWRLLELTDEAKNISGLVCRFTFEGRPGWLELRGNVFYFYSGEIFRWR